MSEEFFHEFEYSPLGDLTKSPVRIQIDFEEEFKGAINLDKFVETAGGSKKPEDIYTSLRREDNKNPHEQAERIKRKQERVIRSQRVRRSYID